ncbi:MAG: hypothetical protein JO112_12840, partial [Planctomycetes bacterium]|nr:hypothetical protein [Planctomycetota bacterium]
MAILTTCPGCGTKLKAPDHLAGTKVKCLKCSSLATVPLPDDPAEPEEVLEAPPRDEEPPPGRHGKETESHRPARRTHEEYERTPTPPARRTVNALGLVAL